MTRSEREVADLLREMRIKWTYEQPVFVWDENKRPIVWTPDLFLISFVIYIKVCGSKGFDYDYRKRIFDMNGYKVIFLYLYKETDRWKAYLIGHLKKISNVRNQILIIVLVNI